MIVIVVIAILAAITIVSYNGINSRARQAAIQSSAEQLAKQILNYKTINGTYPASLSSLNDGEGPKAGDNILYAYTLSDSTTFCATVGFAGSSDTYFVNNTNANPQAGVCSGHLAVLAGYPTRDGYTNISTSYGTGDTMLVPIAPVPVGSWMIVVLGYTNTANAVPPAGWTTLVARKNPASSSLQVSIYGKIKQAGDSDDQLFDAGGVTGSPTTTGVLMWGSNAPAVSSWILGSFGDRAVNATSTSVVVPTTAVATAKSLVLSIALERTIAEETNYTSLVGVTPWIWIAQPTGSSTKLQTIAVGYNEQASTGTSLPMTVTYPNSQPENGTGVQIVLPPNS